MRTILVSPLNPTLDEVSRYQMEACYSQLAKSLARPGRVVERLTVQETHWENTIDLPGLDAFLGYAFQDLNKIALARLIRQNKIHEGDALIFNFTEGISIPMHTLALTYLAVVSRARVSILVGPQHRWMMMQLFAEKTLPNPPLLVFNKAQVATAA